MTKTVNNSQVWSDALGAFLVAIANSGGAGFAEGLRAMSNARRRDLVAQYVIAPEVLTEAVKAGLMTGGERSVTLTSKGYTVIDALRAPVTTQYEAPRVQRRARHSGTPKGPSGSSHAACTHDATSRARAACRKARAAA